MAAKQDTDSSGIHSSDVEPVPRLLKPTLRRIALVDGCNLGNKMIPASYNGHKKDGKFNAIPFLALVSHLLQHGYEVLITLKEFYQDSKTTTYLFILEKLKEMEIVYFLPDEMDDDRVLLQTALEYKGFVISNDRYKQYQGFDDVKKRRLEIKYDHTPLPDRRILEKPEGRYEFQFTYCFDDSFQEDKDYDAVARLDSCRSPSYFQDRLQICDLMADYVQREICFGLGIRPPTLDYVDDGVLPPFADFEAAWRRHVTSSINLH